MTNLQSVSMPWFSLNRDTVEILSKTSRIPTELTLELTEESEHRKNEDVIEVHRPMRRGACVCVYTIC